MASPVFENGGSTSELHRLKASSSGQKVALVKLSDEMIAAIQKANLSRDTSLRISIQKEGGVFTLGNNQQFRFSIQSMVTTPSDVIVQERYKSYQMLGTIQQKFQVQATDKSLDETRHRAKILQEQESQKAAKEVSKTQSNILAHKVANIPNPNRPFDRVKFTPSSSQKNKFPVRPKAGTSSTISTTSTLSTATNRPNMSPNLKADLMRKPLRQRVIHLVVTCRYVSAKDIHERLKRDGLFEKDDDSSKILEVVDEVSETDSDGHLSLRTSLMGEVDQRWPWFTTEEKASLRRNTQPSTSGFAPTRKNGIERPRAQTDSTKKEPGSPQAHPSQPARATQNLVNSQGKKVSPQMARTIQQSIPAVSKPRTPPGAQQTNVDVLDSLLPTKRKAAPAYDHGSDKRARQDSESPPFPQFQRRQKDSECDRERDKNEQERQRLLAATGGSTGGSSVSSTSSGVSSRLSSPILVFPMHPSQDWSKDYPEVKSAQDAEKYYQIFYLEYPEYMRCFEQLDKVSCEFRDLAERLEKARKSKDDLESVERCIHVRYARYEKDTEFMKIRQRHTDLRAKLGLLKSRIAAWETRENSLNASIF